MTLDFVPTSTVKAANRTFTAPITSADTFDGIIQTLTGESNPLGATSYQTAGQTLPGAAVTAESYKAAIQFIEPNEGKTVASLTLIAPTRSACTAAVTRILADTDLAALFGAGVDPVENTTKAVWSVRVRIHDPTGEIYYLTLGRKDLRLTSYENDAILTKVDTWADTVNALN